MIDFVSVQHVSFLLGINGNVFRVHKKKLFWEITIFLHDYVHECSENRARVFQVAKRIAINLYREVTYQRRCHDRARGCRLFYRELYVCILPSVYNNAKDGITTDCSRYPLALIRMHYWCRRHICLLRMINNIKWSRMICSTRIDCLTFFSFLYSLFTSLSFPFFPLFYSPGFSLSYFCSPIFLLFLWIIKI